MSQEWANPRLRLVPLRSGQQAKCIISNDEEGEAKAKQPEAKEADVFPQLFFERQIPVVRSEEGIRAVSKGEAIKPESVEHYLQSKFGEALPEVP